MAESCKDGIRERKGIETRTELIKNRRIYHSNSNAKKLCLKVLPTEHLDARVEQRRVDRRVEHVEGVHEHLDVQLVHVVEEVADAVLVAHVVQQHAPDLPRRHEGADEVVVELVDALKVRGQG